MNKGFKGLYIGMGCLFLLTGCGSKAGRKNEEYTDLNLSTVNMQEFMGSDETADANRDLEMETELSGDERSRTEELKEDTNVYSKPSQNASICGSASEGSSIKIYEIKDGWCKVSYSGRVAYIQAEMFEISENDDEDTDDDSNRVNTNNNNNNSGTANTNTGNTNTGNTNTGNTNTGNIDTGTDNTENNTDQDSGSTEVEEPDTTPDAGDDNSGSTDTSTDTETDSGSGSESEVTVPETGTSGSEDTETIGEESLME